VTKRYVTWITPFNARNRTNKPFKHLTSVALANAAANSEALKTWVEAHTEEELRQANTARRALRRIAKQPLPEGRKLRYLDGSSRVYGQIPLKPSAKRLAATNNAWMMFYRENYHNEEYAGLFAPARSKAISKLFKELTPEEKKVCLPERVCLSMSA